MKNKHKIYSGIKAKIALTDLREDCTANDLCKKYVLCLNQIYQWSTRNVNNSGYLFEQRPMLNCEVKTCNRPRDYNNISKRIVSLLCVIFAVIILSQHAHAQVTPSGLFPLNGQIVNEEKKPMEYVSVFVIHPMMPEKAYKAVTSDKHGRFEVKLPKGNYIVRFSYLGFKPESRNVTLDSLTIGLGTILMKEDASQLPEVTVRPLIEQNAREITYNITSDPERGRSNMLDMFAKTPLLSIIDDKVVAENDPTKSIVVLRNGRVDALFSGGVSFHEVLRRLPAMGFINIKILLDKPEQYKSFDYVISVTPDKTQRLFGAVGESRGSYELTGTLNLSQQVTGSADKLRIAGAAGYVRSYPKPVKSTYAMSMPDFSQYNQEQTTNEADAYIGNISLSHDISAKQFVSGKFSINKVDAGVFKDVSGESQTGTQPVSRTQSHTYMDMILKVFEGQLAYHYDFKPNEKMFSASYTLKASPSDLTQKQNSEQITAGLLNSTLKKTKEQNFSHYFSLDYRDKLTSKFTVNARASLLMSNNDVETRQYETSSGAYTEYDDAYNYFERPVNRLDGSFSFSWLATRQANISGHIRPDYMLGNSRIKSISGTEEPLYYNEHKWAFESGLGVNFIFDKKKKSVKENKKASSIPQRPSTPTQLNINYSITQTRPAYMLLFSYIDDSNPNYLSTGNPNLKGETVHTIRVVSSGKIGSANLSYNFSNDKATNYWYQNSENKLVKSYINGGMYRNISGGLSKSFWLSKDHSKIRIMILSASGGYIRSEIDGNNQERYLAMGSATFQANLFKGYSLAVNLTYSNSWNSGYNGSNPVNPLALNARVNRTFRFKNGIAWMVT